MARWSVQKKDELESVAGEILHNYSRGRSLVAVDGRHGSGQRDFADALAETLIARGAKVFRAHIDDFYQPRNVRDREGVLDGAAHYRTAYDYSLFRRVLIDPFHAGGSTGFVLVGFDAVRDQPVFQAKWMSAGPDAILIVDGVFLLRPELSGLWNYSLWLSAPAVPSTDPDRVRDAAADDIYLTTANPSEAATAIIDNQNPDLPQRIFADSC